MMRPKFSVVIPTVGRQTLPLTLESIRSQGGSDEIEVLVVADTFGLGEDIRKAIQSETKRWDARYSEVDAGFHDWGSPQLQHGYSMATGAVVQNLGDDDVYLPGAFATILGAIDAQPEPGPLMFRTILHPAPQRGNSVPVTLWEYPALVDKNITGQCFVIPNDQTRIGRWDILVDFGFITDTVRLWDGKLVWREEIISQCW